MATAHAQWNAGRRTCHGRQLPAGNAPRHAAHLAAQLAASHAAQLAWWRHAAAHGAPKLAGCAKAALALAWRHAARAAAVFPAWPLLAGAARAKAAPAAAAPAAAPARAIGPKPAALGPKPAAGAATHAPAAPAALQTAVARLLLPLLLGGGGPVPLGGQQLICRHGPQHVAQQRSACNLHGGGGRRGAG